MIPRLSFFAIIGLLVLVPSTQAKTFSLLQVEAEDDTTMITDSSTTSIFKDTNTGKNDRRPISLIEKTRVLRERRDLYRRSLQGGFSFSFTDVPTSSPTIRAAGDPTSEPTDHGGKAGPYRTLQPTTSEGKAGPYRTTSPTEAPPGSSDFGSEPRSERSARNGVLASRIAGKNGRSRTVDDHEEGEADDGSNSVGNLIKNWRDNKAGSRRNLLRGDQTSSSSSSDSTSSSTASTFDFVVAGFPKCGTTTLLKAFESHAETAMAANEQCAITEPGPDAAVMDKLDVTLQTLSSSDASDATKRSLKCPTAVYSHRTISRMQEHSPDAKFIIGVRHPVWMLQSFYNYRVTEIYERMLSEPIPSFEQVLSQDEPWKGLSLEATRFDLFLKQFAKTSMSSDEMGDLMGHEGYDIAIQPNNFEIFFYDVEQLEDTDEARSDAFRQELATFLDLKSPLAPFGHENKNHFVGKASFPETVDICAPQHEELRAVLVEQGAHTARWLVEQFMASNDITVANKDHLIASLQKWGTDPCNDTRQLARSSSSISAS